MSSSRELRNALARRGRVERRGDALEVADRAREGRPAVGRGVGVVDPAEGVAARARDALLRGPPELARRDLRLEIALDRVDGRAVGDERRDLRGVVFGGRGVERRRRRRRDQRQ